MSIVSRAKLIPRYNWDYGLRDLSKALRAAIDGSVNCERSFENIFGQRPVLTASGRTSLYAILNALNLPHGACVAVPLFCCPVVFDAIVHAGLIPRFIDINLDDYTISAADLEQKKGAYEAIVVVHMFGHPADMDAINAVAGGMPVIEDCAHSLFSIYKGKYTGLLGDASFFSFRSGKYISAGEGSAIFARDPALRDSISKIVEKFPTTDRKGEILHCLATYIKSTLYNRPWYGTVGYPIGRRLDKKLNLSAKTGFRAAQIARCDSEIIDERIREMQNRIQRQRQNALHLLKELDGLDVFLPLEKKGCTSNYYQFALRFETTAQRDKVAEILFEKGLDCARYLDEIIDIAAEQFGYKGECLLAEKASKTVLSVPHYFTLNRMDINVILSLVADAIRRSTRVNAVTNKRSSVL